MHDLPIPHSELSRVELGSLPIQMLRGKELIYGPRASAKAPPLIFIVLIHSYLFTSADCVPIYICIPRAVCIIGLNEELSPQ